MTTSEKQTKQQNELMRADGGKCQNKWNYIQEKKIEATIKRSVNSSDKLVDEVLCDLAIFKFH